MTRIPFIHARFAEMSQSRLEIATRLENRLRKLRRESTRRAALDCRAQQADGESGPDSFGIDADTRVTPLNSRNKLTTNSIGDWTCVCMDNYRLS